MWFSEFPLISSALIETSTLSPDIERKRNAPDSIGTSLDP